VPSIFHQRLARTWINQTATNKPINQ
jgi:hypothetical protein